MPGTRAVVQHKIGDGNPNFNLGLSNELNFHGVRLYALPPPSESWSDGYVEMSRAMKRMIGLVNAA